jgi:hypothetical protein
MKTRFYVHVARDGEQYEIVYPDFNYYLADIGICNMFKAGWKVVDYFVK